MAFFDKVSDLGKAAAKKSGEMLEVTKVNVKITEKKSKLKEVEVQLGKHYYEQYQAGAILDATAVEFCEKMKEIEESIEELKESLKDGDEEEGPQL